MLFHVIVLGVVISAAQPFPSSFKRSGFTGTAGVRARGEGS